MRASGLEPSLWVICVCAHQGQLVRASKFELRNRGEHSESRPTRLVTDQVKAHLERQQGRRRERIDRTSFLSIEGGSSVNQSHVSDRTSLEIRCLSPMILVSVAQRIHTHTLDFSPSCLASRHNE